MTWGEIYHLKNKAANLIKHVLQDTTTRIIGFF